MSRDGNGVYNLLVNSWNPAVDGNAATPADWQALIDDVAAAITQSVSSDGQTPMTGDLNMNGNKIEDIANGVAVTDAASVDQIYNQGVETNVVSAATTDIGSINSNFIRVSGTATITSLGTNYRGPRFVRFANVMTLTHNATTLILPGAVNITTAVGDTAIFTPKGNPSDGWNCVNYRYANGIVVNNTGSGDTAVFNDASGDTSPVVINAAGNVAVGRTTAPADVKLVVDIAGSSTIPTLSETQGLCVVNGAGTAAISLLSSTTGTASLRFGDTASDGQGAVSYRNDLDRLQLQAAGSVKWFLESNGIFNYTGTAAATATAGSLVTSGRIQSDASFSVTTATAANLVVAADGLFARSTSALKYKTDLQPITEGQIQAYLGMTGYSYISKADGDDKTIRHFGMVADYAHEAGLRELVNYGKDGEIEGYNYGRDTAILLEIVKRQQATIEELNDRISALEEA